jgi:hypothetical protein
MDRIVGPVTTVALDFKSIKMAECKPALRQKYKGDFPI